MHLINMPVYTIGGTHGTERVIGNYIINFFCNIKILSRSSLNYFSKLLYLTNYLFSFLHLVRVRTRPAVLVQVWFGLEGDSAGHTRIRPFIRVCPDMFLKDTRLGPRHRTVRTRIAVLPGLGGGLDSPCRLRRRFELVVEFLRRLLAVLVIVLSLRCLIRDDVVCRALLLDDFRRNFSRRHLLELLV